MNRFFSIYPNRTLLNVCLLLLRLGFGGGLLTHGLPKFQRLSAGNMKFGDPLGLGPELSLYLVVFAEVFCALLVVLGGATRIAAFFAAFTMAVAAFVAHGGEPFGEWETSFLYLVAFAALVLAGPGRYSLDAVFSREKGEDLDD